jgi:hypothetical protein
MVRKNEEVTNDMRQQLINALSIATVFMFVSGCSTNSERAAKMSANGPKTTRMSDTQYYAMCRDQTPGGHMGVWKGPVRTAKEWAIRDAGQHEKEYPGHHATIER